MAAADLYTYDISSSALQRLRILLQKLAHRGTALLIFSFPFLFLPNLVRMSLCFLFSSPCPSCTRVIVLSWQLPPCEAGRASQGVSPLGARNKNSLLGSRLAASGQPSQLVFAGSKVALCKSHSSCIVHGNTRVCNKMQHLQSAAAAPSV